MEQLPSYQELKSIFPLSSTQEQKITQDRQTVISILNGTDPRLLLIVGPCSIHDPASAKEYALKLKALAKSVESHFFILMRVYCEKPRTTTGWKGLLYDPHLDGSHAIETGIQLTRQLLLDIAEIGIPAATEFLDPLTTYYYEDLITWGSIGARTSSSQPHRQLASGLPIPIGFKNGIAGNISAALQGMISASHPHIYPGLNALGSPSVIRTSGNKNTHIVLRGGESGVNYDPCSVQKVIHRLNELHLPPRVVIDCSHQNSGKVHYRQAFPFRSAIEQVLKKNHMIRGIMLESHLFDGQQPHHSDRSFLSYGLSITDSCIGWEATVSLIQWANNELSLFYSHKR